MKLKELRCILFDKQQLAAALVETRQRRGESMPSGTIREIEIDGDGEETDISIVLTVDADADNRRSSVLFGHTEICAALIAFCLVRKIPMPAKFDKSLARMGTGVALILSQNFRRAARQAASRAAGRS